MDSPASDSQPQANLPKLAFLGPVGSHSYQVGFCTIDGFHGIKYLSGMLVCLEWVWIHC